MISFSHHWNFEVMDVLGSENIKALLPWFVCRAVPDSWAYHDLNTVHVIVHHIMESGQKIFLAYRVEVNFFRSSDLDPIITSYEEEKASNWNRVVELPFSWAILAILNNFEKTHDVRGTGS